MRPPSYWPTRTQRSTVRHGWAGWGLFPRCLIPVRSAACRGRCGRYSLTKCDVAGWCGRLFSSIRSHFRPRDWHRISLIFCLEWSWVSWVMMDGSGVNDYWGQVLFRVVKIAVHLVCIDSARFKLLAIRLVVVDGRMWVSCKLTSALFK
jgi:hypothetical protein